ncbi:hypothetical protein [Streptomyces gilvus]|uniref:hypothetical protein n=1 Tax=Streptomyces gilvus TaxID=2920937 RepID=UPI001F0E7E72|nr:hypothetical protein [Streptomyces sp. CME 23]MCH5674925.1 hypothetical protein [Streptomyces sp. CME 23]
MIASTSQATMDQCRERLADTPDVEFRTGSVPETSSNCDAAVMWWPLAHEQHGGTPQPGVAQVLLNTLDPDEPEIILATPPGPGGTTGVGPSDVDIEEYTFHTLDACIREYVQYFPESCEQAVILIHLEAAGLNRRSMAAPLRGLERFLRSRK